VNEEIVKTTLFYFSGTGNSLQVARDLARELGDTDLVSIPRTGTGSVATESDCIGIVFPVYNFRMPTIVSQFVDRLAPDGNKYYFAVCTCGMLAVGTLRAAAKQFKSRGMRLSAAFIVRMPGNAIVMYDVWPEKRQQKRFSEASQRIVEIAETVKARKETRIEGGPLPLDWLLKLPQAYYDRFVFPTFDNKYWVDEKCNGCGICEALCPTANIKIVNNRPTWHHSHCEYCLACLNWCPRHAIQYGKDTVKRGRYHNPSVKAKDLFVRALKRT